MIMFYIPTIRDTFRGVLPKNQLPTNLNNKKCHSYIVNLDKFGYPGSHWVAFFIDHHYVYYFDSYGINPQIDEYIMNFSNNLFRDKLLYSDTQIQSTTSSVCGLYCIYFLYIMNTKLFSFIDFVNLFNDNHNINDHKILTIFKDIFLKLNMIDMYNFLLSNNS